MSAELELLMHAAADVARLAGDVAARYYRKGVAVDVKADGSPVTVADRAAETAAREWIERRFAGDGILGEEFGLARPDAPRRWILDPIDGTKSFVRGVPLWGTLVAVVAVLLPDHALARPLRCDPLAEQALDRAVGVGDRRQVRLRVDDEVGGAETGKRDRVGEIGELEGEGEIAVHRAR